MNHLLDDIHARAEVTPWLPAVRVADEVVTYGELATALFSYDAVVEKYGMSRESAFYAAIMHTLPSVASLTNVDDQSVIVDQIIGWLSRHLPPSAGGLQVAG